MEIMSKVAVLKAKLEKHQTYYDAKFAEYKQMDVSSKKSLNRYSRLLTLSNLITSLIIELNNEMAIAAFVDEGIVEGQKIEIVKGVRGMGAVNLGGLYLDVKAVGVDEALEKLNCLNDLLREANSLVQELASVEVKVNFVSQQEP